MMVKPSMTELLKIIDNRFELVIVTAKRARQISDGSPVLIETDEIVPVTIATNEIAQSKVTVC